MTTVLFVCVHNSGRSQMAEAFTRHLSGERVHAESAGTVVSHALNPMAVEAMREIGIDISRQHPKLITQDMVDRADRVYTMGCAIDEACPAVFIPSEDWGLDDPAGKDIDAVRRIRDQVHERVERMLDELTAARCYLNRNTALTHNPLNPVNLVNPVNFS